MDLFLLGLFEGVVHFDALDCTLNNAKILE